MNGYIAFYNGNEYQVIANSSFEAQTKVAAQLNVKKSKQYQIDVYLAEKNGVQATQLITN